MESFTCFVEVVENVKICGGVVSLMTGKDRKYSYRKGIALDIPDDHEMPTCDICGETYSSISDNAALNVVLAPLFSSMNKDAYDTGYLNALTDFKNKYPHLAKEADEMYYAAGEAQLEEALKKTEEDDLF